MNASIKNLKTTTACIKNIKVSKASTFKPISWENYPSDVTPLTEETLNKLDVKAHGIPKKPQILKCLHCGAPLKEGQTKCEWCRTVYRWE